MRLARNVLANVAQTVLGTVLLFALYRYVNGTLGVEQLGVWAVVLATASVSRLADLGLGGSVTRFVARDRARGDGPRAVQAVDTTFLTLLVTVGAVLPLLYPALAAALPWFLQGRALADGLAVLPYALVSLWLTLLASVLQGGLDGCERMDLRAASVVLGQVLMLALAMAWVPSHGLAGLALAQIAQAAATLLASRVLLRRALPGLPWWPRRWARPVLREMLGYAANLQLAAIAMLFFDAATKALMARFGGASAAGYFEMANQLVQKLRAVIVTANQAVVPHMARLAETDPSHLRQVYRANLRLLAFFALPAFALLLAWAGGFSWLLIGRVEAPFVSLLWAVGLAWLLNVFCGPAYFSNLGTGHVGRNTISHVGMGVLNVALGWMLGARYGAAGVAAGYVAALAAGSVYLLATYRQAGAAPAGGRGAGEHALLALACVAVAALAWWAPLRPGADAPMRVALGVAAPLAVLGLALWRHPLRRELTAFARRGAAPAAAP